MRRAFRCSHTWRIWSRAARSRPRARPRSTAFIGWRSLSGLRVALLALLDRLRRLVGRRIFHRVVDRRGKRDDPGRIGAEVMAAIAGGGGGIDARGGGSPANAEHAG